METNVIQAIAGLILMVVGLTGKPVIRVGKFRQRPMTRSSLPAILLIAGQHYGSTRTQHLGAALNTDASLVMMVVGSLLLYISFATKMGFGGNPLLLKGFKVCAFAAGSIELIENAYLIAMRIAS